MEIGDHAITFTYFDVGTGDAIWIRFLGNDQRWHHLLVDGGYGYAYKMAFGPLIRQILGHQEVIDFWLISHIDMDHIGAVLGLFGDKKLKDKAAIVREFWFNHSPMLIKSCNGKLAVKEGVALRDFLKPLGLLAESPILGSESRIDLHGLKITALTPTAAKLATADALWQTEEKGGKLGRTAERSDHRETIDALKGKRFSPDTDPVNGSSISCLLEYKGLRFLLLADSHPEDVVTALRDLGYNEKKPLQAELVQLAHHGSKANTSPELLGLLRCERFVVTGNGQANAHPDKETLVRVLTHPDRADTLSFAFPYGTSEVVTLFAADGDAAAAYNFTCEYPQEDEHSLSLSYLPIELPAHD
ncbi:beta-lactamase superfamily II metal-dependent hydrolase [Mucilaginibacter sp. UYP25]|uniref:ComEC/Rec2 family competence protein n=1 Tax=unclassified Mucilaginibacter TaxID=2617802 RepID=UPI003393FB52